MDAVTKAIKKIRGQIRPKDNPATALEIYISERQEEIKLQNMWEMDKKINRQTNFAKAQLVRQISLEEQRLKKEAEAERQSIIAENRTKNLKKARRRLRWLRKQENLNE